jgi:hypothetical protein
VAAVPIASQTRIKINYAILSHIFILFDNTYKLFINVGYPIISAFTAPVLLKARM